jgi:hypothetical protein
MPPGLRGTIGGRGDQPVNMGVEKSAFGQPIVRAECILNLGDIRPRRDRAASPVLAYRDDKALLSRGFESLPLRQTNKINNLALVASDNSDTN